MSNLDSLSPSAIEPEAYMEESYALLHEGLQEFLANKSLQLETQSTDYLEAILEKINMSIVVAQENDHRESLEELKKTVWTLIYEQFTKDYEGVIEPSAVSVDSQSDMRFVYYFFYFNRRRNVLDMMVASAISQRKDLAQRFKKETKKDFMLPRLKEEVPEISPTYISLVAFYQEIAAEYISSGADLTEEINGLVLNYDQVSTIHKIFDGMDVCEAFHRYVCDFPEHDDFPHITTEFRDELVEKLKGLN
jgi:hypothetical protein